MISTKESYAIRFMIDMAEQTQGMPVPHEDTAADLVNANI